MKKSKPKTDLEILREKAKRVVSASPTAWSVPWSTQEVSDAKDVAKAWLADNPASADKHAKGLTEPEGDTPITTRLLKTFGFELQDNSMAAIFRLTTARGHIDCVPHQGFLEWHVFNTPLNGAGPKTKAELETLLKLLGMARSTNRKNDD